MNSIDGFKTCRKGLHQYPANQKQCPECKKASKQRWYEDNIDRARENKRRWEKENLERVRQYKRRWSKKNPDRLREINQGYYQRNRDQVLKTNRSWREKNIQRTRDNSKRWKNQNLERHRKNCRNWRKENSEKIRAYAGHRRAKEKQATPCWADKTAINAIYMEAARLQKETGIPHHVDHIYPLTSPYMCGLHVAENLQVLPGPENCSKGNRTWPGQLECQRRPPHANGFQKNFNDNPT